MTKRRVVIGFLGTTLDIGKDRRWERWRPTVALCQHEDFKVDRLDLIHSGERTRGLAARIASDIATVSAETQVRSHIIAFKDPWDFEEVYSGLRDFADAYAFDVENEDYYVNITTGTHVAQICWFLLIEAHYIPAKILQLSPPKRWGAEPGSYDCIDIDLARYDRIATRFAAEKRDATSFLKSGIPTRNAAFNAMIDRIEQVAIRSRAPLLLTGPTGAGKSQLARRIFELKKQRHRLRGEFVEVNCATLRGDAAMSALFGHAKGAFTGALSDRPGLLRKADGGILFLDEIGELGLDEQAMILRAIEEKRFLPMGSDKEATSDFQLIAGTNRDLSRSVREGKFREDLLARLNLWTFRLPGLKDRREDIEPNLDFELRRFSESSGARVTFNREAYDRYLAFAVSPQARWSANFRDLGASITRMATLAPAGRVTEAIVLEEIDRLAENWTEPGKTGDCEALAKLIGEEEVAALDLFDRLQLAAVVRVCREHNTLSAAGRALFSASRAQKLSVNDADRLRKYLARFGLEWKAIAAA
jgi:transcriptional regulatory protein RtcR